MSLAYPPRTCRPGSSITCPRNHQVASQPGPAYIDKTLDGLKLYHGGHEVLDLKWPFANYENARPPLITRFWPVMKLASSLPKKATPAAISCGWPYRPNGIKSVIRFFSSGE